MTTSTILPHITIPISFLFFLTLIQLVNCQSVVSTIVVTVGPAIPSDAPSFVDHDTFTSAILNSTNTYRATYNASSVRWNSTLESFASTYVQSSSRKRDDDDEKCMMKHSGGPYGENLALGCSTAGSCVDAWASEVSKYDFDDPGFGEETGHFTQLVWRDTTDVGCGAKLCPGNGGWYLACEYWPRGNVEGGYSEEVSRPEGMGVVVRPSGCAALLVAAGAVVAWWGLLV
ncbi:PR-1-like protein [Hypoxylon rubiginosum]|uniref:PR-1-like protein n=1 Tax=Hypoxylon rubiginosum TaxID=110542 RepID=A0ACC0CQV8_9PEZI|nr:PR-1-like protein [Hypoxylon rubiginosum]